MIKCTAIYPNYITKDYVRKVKEAVQLAHQYHFQEIFTTIHLPEFTLDEQLAAFRLIAGEARRRGLEVTVDIGGAYIEQFLNDEDKLHSFKETRPDFVRLDYGYRKEQVKALYEILNIRGFVVNASIYQKEELDEIIAFFRSMDEKMEIRACHNFYIREGSGIDSVYALKQDSYLKEYLIPIYYCIPSYSHPREPLRLGSCTLEKHRYQSIRVVLADLYLNHSLNAFMMADEWMCKQEYEEAEETLTVLESRLQKEETINVIFFDHVSEEEKKIVLKDHVFRKDSPDQFLRSQSSRQMAEFACPIEKNHTEIRNEGSITIDNKYNKRYSGELQVVTRKAPADEKVNVVARLAHSKDLLKLLRFREGIIYRFQEAAE